LAATYEVVARYWLFRGGEGGRPSLTSAHLLVAARAGATTRGRCLLLCRCPIFGYLLFFFFFFSSSCIFGHFGQLHLVGSSTCPPCLDFSLGFQFTGSSDCIIIQSLLHWIPGMQSLREPNKFFAVALISLPY
jgi:hypothetical protein